MYLGTVRQQRYLHHANTEVTDDVYILSFEERAVCEEVDIRPSEARLDRKSVV